MKPPEEQIRQIIEDHKLTFFYPYPSKHITMITEIARAYHAQFEPASLQSLIERVEKHKYAAKGLNNAQKAWNDAFDVAIKEICSTPCIKKTAVRQKETGKWYYVSMDINRGWLTQSEFALVDEFWLDSVSLPSDAELIDIEILINKP